MENLRPLEDQLLRLPDSYECRNFSPIGESMLQRLHILCLLLALGLASGQDADAWLQVIPAWEADVAELRSDIANHMVSHSMLRYTDLTTDVQARFDSVYSDTRSHRDAGLSAMRDALRKYIESRSLQSYIHYKRVSARQEQVMATITLFNLIRNGVDSSAYGLASNQIAVWASISALWELQGW